MLETVTPLTPADPTDAAIERAFHRHVSERLNGGVLRYSQRLEFLKSAQRLRINRFRANLIIATVQHHLPKKPAVAEPKAANHSNAKSIGTFPLVAGVMVAELLTIAGVWWIFHL